MRKIGKGKEEMSKKQGKGEKGRRKMRISRGKGLKEAENLFFSYFFLFLLFTFRKLMKNFGAYQNGNF